MNFFRIFILSLCFLFTGTVFAAADLSVARVTPTGDDVAQRDQIVIEFNRAVVPLGRMDRKADEIPVVITPAAKCQWRWLTTNTLACQLNDKEQLKSATHYVVTINPGIKAEDGGMLKAPVTHQFVTTRPNISDVWLSTWLAPNKPVIRVSFNQAVTEQSLTQHLFFTDKKSNQRIAAHIEKEPQSKNYSQTEEEGEAAHISIDQNQNWLVIPAKELPSNSEVSLEMEPGIMPKEGSEGSTATKELLTLHTFAEFKFLGLTCRNVAGKEVVITADKPQLNTEDGLCDPTAAINLRFTTPVSTKEFKQHIQFKPTIKNLLKDNQQDDQNNSDDFLTNGVQPTADYIFNMQVWTDTPLKGMQQYTVNMQSTAAYSWWAKLLSYIGIKPKSAVVDAFGRHLEQPITINFKTGHRKSNYVLPYSMAVLEKNTDSDVPFYVTNIQSLQISYDKVTQAGMQSNLQMQRMLPAVTDLQFAVPLEIRKLLAGQSGLIKMDITTQPKVGDAPAGLVVEVTPYQVEAKIGHFNSLIWVTDFVTGQPVANAKVTLYPAPKDVLSVTENVFATAQTDKDGLALVAGTAQFKTDKQPKDSAWTVRVDTAHDMAVLPLNYDFQVNSYRMGDVYNSNREKYGHIIAWGATAQGIYRPGETVQYKIYVRDQDVRTLVPAPQQNYQLEIKDPSGKTVETIKNIKLNEFGSLQGEYTVAKEAVAGWYEFSLSSDFAKDTWQPLRVLVTDFTPSPFKVTNQLNGEAFTPGQNVEVTSLAKLHAGGPYGNASLRLTAAIVPKSFTTKNPSLKDFDFYQPGTERDAIEIYQKIFTLDKNGESRAQFKLEPQTITYGKLSVESAVQDERGKYVVAHTQSNYFGVDRFLGWHPKGWVFTAGKPAQVDYVVVDTKGNPVANTKVNIAIEREVYKAARVKSAGEVYTTEYKQTWESAGTCEASSQQVPNSCVFTPQQAGNYQLTAKLVDSKGVAYTTKTSVWVTGSDYVVWNQDSDAAIPIIPEKSAFQVGEKARFLIKNPYPGALALITVERYGVIDRWVQKLDGSTPMIAVPIKPDYLPGFYLSVSVFTPRANNNPLQVGQIDLAKPAARFGYLKVNVDDPYKQLLITAKTDRETYKPGETVQLQMQVKPKEGQVQPVELAVAVVDEAVLDLLHDANKHYDIYHGLYQLDALDVTNYSLISRLVGRQKFEKKGATPGGDGGAAFSMRSIFKYVSYWNPSIVVDARGNATTSFTVPDNLTRWRVIVLGITKTDQMGTGSTDFTVNRPTELRPVMPNHVLAGDHFIAGFSVMNRLQKTRTLTVDIAAAGAINAKQSATHYKTTVTLEPFQRTVVTMPIVVNDYDYANASTSAITFKATAGDALDTDGLVQKIPVDPLVSLETSASYGTADKNQVQQSVAVPDKIYANAGGLQLSLSPTVIGNIEGVFRYGRDYPYTCWEQKLTKALLASQFKALKVYLAPSLEWSGSDELPSKTLQDAVNFQASNGGMAYFTATDQYTDPYLSAYTALAFSWLQHQGYSVPETVTKNLTTYLQKFLRQDRSRDFYTESMTATVRAVALAALAQTNSIDATDLDRLHDYLPNMSLFGLANYLQAAIHVPNTDALQQVIVNKIMSHAQHDADKVTFTETLDDSYARILASPLRDTCAVLTAMLDYQQAHPHENYQDKLFKMVRGITQARGAKDHWENTQENLFCMNALTRYSETYEKQTPKMQLTASINNEKLGAGRLDSLRDTVLTFVRPLTAADIGKKFNIDIQRDGVGRYYYNTRLQYAPLAMLSQDENHGIEIHREYSVQRNNKWVLLNTVNNTIKQGELIRVDLYLSLAAPRNFVVVDDPVAGGLEPVNAELATSSTVDTGKASYQAAGGALWLKFGDWSEYNVSFWSFYHEEMRNDAVRFYSDHLEPGRYHLNYIAQAISSGEFTILPTIAQEMYTPEVNGKTTAGKLVVNK